MGEVSICHTSADENSPTKAWEIYPRHTSKTRTETTVCRLIALFLKKNRGFGYYLFQAIRSWDDSTTSSISFAAQLNSMAEEMIELSKTIDRKRKILKHDSLRDETNVTVAEGIAEKARSKWDYLQTDLERAVSASRGESYPPQKGRFVMSRRSGAQVRFNVV